MRANGMQYPFHPLQVTTWLLFPLITGEYFALLMPVLSPMPQYAVTPFYCFFVLLSLVSATVTSGIDPHDPHVPTTPMPSSTLVRMTHSADSRVTSPLPHAESRQSRRPANTHASLLTVRSVGARQPQSEQGDMLLLSGHGESGRVSSQSDAPRSRRAAHDPLGVGARVHIVQALQILRQVRAAV